MCTSVLVSSCAEASNCNLGGISATPTQEVFPERLAGVQWCHILLTARLLDQSPGCWLWVLPCLHPHHVGSDYLFLLCVLIPSAQLDQQILIISHRQVGKAFSQIGLGGVEGDGMAGGKGTISSRPGNEANIVVHTLSSGGIQIQGQLGLARLAHACTCV